MFLLELDHALEGQASPDVVGVVAKQVKACTLGLQHYGRTLRASIRSRPSAMRKLGAIFAAVAGRDHPVQRHMFEDSDFP